MSARHGIPWGLLALLVLASCGGGKGDTGSSGPVDADGDGYTADEDCDDSDASVYPGAPETWYDGVDSDCRGDDDYDADGDGVRGAEGGGADCDDSDPNVNPAVEETWYDGVDSDCRGDDDYDADVDGFQSADYGGTDCDDSDPDVWPGAADTWYDGIDSDCDGASDYDADRDGQDSAEYGGEDCDDSDATIYVGAEETWYDGIDENCDGASDYDADADGWDADGYGGDDCADDDPDAWPGAAEQVDGHDTDCDGQADDFAVDGDYEGSAVVGLVEEGGLGDTFALWDLDGDGAEDLLVGAPEADPALPAGGQSGLHVFPGADLAAGPMSTADAAAVLESDTATGPFGAIAPYADLDGDGVEEAVVGAPWAPGAGGIPRGEVAIVTAADLLAGTTWADARWTVTASTPAGEFGSVVANAGDLDGDGTDELVIAAPQAGGGAIYVMLGSTATAGPGTWTASDLDGSWQVASSASSGAGFGSAIAAAGDVDGDGYADLAVGAPGAESSAGAVYVLLGGGPVPFGNLEDTAWAAITGDHAGDQAGTALGVGDLDGDGGADLVVGAPYESTQAGRVHVLALADVGPGAQALGDVDWVSYVGDTNFGHAGTALAVDDVDGDGADDLLVGGPGESSAGSDAGTVWLVLSGLTGSRALANADASFAGASVEDRAGTAVALGDVDGDGMPDLVLGVPGEDSVADEGAVYIGFNGF